jgi:hypothetical protein
MKYSLIDPRRARTSIGLRWGASTAVMKARRLCRSKPASIYLCWDLDNTLVGSGTLLRAGRRLEDAIVEAEPVPNMLGFYDAIRMNLSDAQHFILSARMRSMRHDTIAWLGRYGLPTGDGALCFVPRADTKPRVWEQLAREGTLVIIDDLSFSHESDRPSVYAELIRVAKRTACVYIGVDVISRIAADAKAIDDVVEATVEAVSRCRAARVSPSAEYSPTTAKGRWSPRNRRRRREELLKLELWHKEL